MGERAHCQPLAARQCALKLGRPRTLGWVFSEAVVSGLQGLNVGCSPLLGLKVGCVSGAGSCPRELRYGWKWVASTLLRLKMVSAAVLPYPPPIPRNLPPFGVPCAEFGLHLLYWLCCATGFHRTGGKRERCSLPPVLLGSGDLLSSCTWAGMAGADTCSLSDSVAGILGTFDAQPPFAVLPANAQCLSLPLHGV